jgi:hypothetical protein
VCSLSWFFCLSGIIDPKPTLSGSEIILELCLAGSQTRSLNETSFLNYFSDHDVIPCICGLTHILTIFAFL